MLKITGIKKSFGKTEVLKGVDITVNKGDVVAVLGPSGSGKTTMLRCINFLETADSGELEFDEIKTSLDSASKKTINDIRKKTAFVFQNYNLFDNKTALENVMEGLVTVKKIKKDEARKIAMRELVNVGMAQWANHYPKHLSGGQQQRVALARALAMKPQVLLLDEPTSALDPELVGEVLDVIKRVAEKGYTMILVSHEMNFVRHVSNRVIFLDKGHIVEDGTPKEVFDNPKNERTIEFFRKMNLMNEPDYVI